MPDTLTIEDRVRKIVAEHLGVMVASVTDEAELVDDLGADSLDSVELSIALDDEFGIDIQDTKVEVWRTAGDLVRTVREALA